MRVGDADAIARALSMVARILPRLRMIEASRSSRSTSCSVIAATSATSKPREAVRKAPRFPNTIDQLSPTWNTPSVSASKIAGADAPWLPVVPDDDVAAHPTGPAAAHRSSYIRYAILVAPSERPFITAWTLLSQA